MLISELKPILEIITFLDKEKHIAMVACAGCSEVCQSSSANELKNVAAELKKKKKVINEPIIVDFLCNKVLARIKLLRNKEKWKNAESILVFSCGIGIQALAKIVTKPIHPATNTISLGGYQGVWLGEERCEQCGNCVLDLTGGICPYTSCAKAMLNGPCGGSSNGECEVEKGRDCGWYQIYERLKEMGKIENMKKIKPLRDYSRMLPKKEIRALTFYDIDR